MAWLSLALLAAAARMPVSAGAATTATTVHPLPVIIDTDVGDDIDDAFALTLALNDPRVEVIGVTTAWGDTRTRTLLVRRLLATLGRRDVVVAQGPATVNAVPFTQRKWASGATDTSPARDAIEFISEQAHKRPGEITLVALAPLSNIEALARRDPEALHELRQVVMMGGSIHAGYNQGGAIPVAEPSAEYNVASAPGGLVALLQSKVAVRMFPLDSTQIKLVEPSTCPVTPLRIAVDERGYTRPVSGTANVEVCLSVDESATLRLVMDTLAPTESPRSVQ